MMKSSTSCSSTALLQNLVYRFWQLDKMRGKAVPGKAIFVLCLASFLAGSLFASRTWTRSKTDVQTPHGFTKLGQVQKDSDHKRKPVQGKSEDIMGQVTKAQQAIQSLDKTISSLEMELAAARTSQKIPVEMPSNHSLHKAFVVIGINTAFSSKKRRDSLRQTWLPKGTKLGKLEKEKGIVIRFVIGHSRTPAGGALDRAIDAEEADHKDFLRLDHVEAYHDLSTKTKALLC